MDILEKVLVIVGPTAVGKTATSIKLAQKFNGEIISGDSMQVYKQLDIGTAKVTLKEQQGVKHYLINCREIDEAYSVADFQKEGRLAIETILMQKKLPIIVGGTGLYIQSLLYDYQLGAKDESPNVRIKYEQYVAINGNQKLWELLASKDPLAAKAIHHNNQRKVIRALEVFEKTGRSILEPKEQPQKLYDYLLIGLDTQRSLLYERINQRVDYMLEQGLLDEAKLLYNQPTKQSFQGIGYKEFFPYFMQEETFEEAVNQVKQNSRRYAKRQLTWFKNRMNTSWWDLIQFPEELNHLEEKIQNWLDNSEG